MNTQPTPQAKDATLPESTPIRRPAYPWAILCFVWLLIVIVATLVTFILPESFSSTARIKIAQDQPDFPAMVDRGTAAGYDPYFIQTEFEVVRSEAILESVIAKLNLNQKWASKYLGQQGGKLKTQETMRFLRGNLALNTIRNTSIIEITLYSDKPEEAAQLANAIAEAYRDYRFASRSGRLSASIQGLKRAYEQNNMQLEELQAASAKATNHTDEAKGKLDELQRFGQGLYGKIAMAKTELTLPATGMVEVIERAVPVMRPVRPNKPLNIGLGILIGGLAGCFLATLIYALQVRAFRRLSAIPKMQYPPRFRAIVHILIALALGIIFGYMLAVPLSWATIIGLPLCLLLGGCVSAYIELAHPLARPPSI